MAKKTFTVVVDDDYVAPKGPIKNDADYVNHVMNMAAQSYGNHPDAKSPLNGITVAREAANAALEPEEEAAAPIPDAPSGDGA